MGMLAIDDDRLRLIARTSAALKGRASVVVMPRGGNVRAADARSGICLQNEGPCALRAASFKVLRKIIKR